MGHSYDDDDDGEGDDDDDNDDVNRAPTAFARRNYQQPESYKSSLQKHQAYHGHAGKAMIGPLIKVLQTLQCRGIKHENILPVIWLKTF